MIFALEALQLELIPVNAHVFVEVALLGEGLIAFIHRADERFFLRVRAQMV